LQVIPAIDVLAGEVVRLRHGDFDQVTAYSSDPVAVATGWCEEGATMVHVVDLDGARTGRPDREMWRRLAAAGVPFQVGGGIRRGATAREALATGAARVVMGTAAVWDPSQLAGLDSARVVAAVDTKEGFARGRGWQEEGRPLAGVLAGVVAAGVGRILLTAIGRDGTMEGPDLDLLRQVTRDRPELAVIASGGVGSLEDLRSVAATGCEAVVVGKALYEGRFTLPEAQEAVSRRPLND
jgi:phosphoribosylformimino-5-aminoimidazole carboxamide ribotide isomerase